jgi:DNA-binding CsgD family transcriptional regulator
MAMPAIDGIRDELDRLAQAGLDRHGFARAAVRVLRRAVPFDGVAVVWFDPATGLPVDRWIDHCSELDKADLDEFRRLAASGRRAARTGRHGLGDELRAVYAGDSGMWGAIVMRREPGAPDFTSRDVDLLASLTRGCPEAQRARLELDLTADTGDRDRGLLLLDEEDGIEMADAVAAAWLDELRDDGQRPPLVVTAVADRARAIASGQSDVAATARVPARSGRWIVVRGSVLGNGAHARTAVTLEPARAPELAELIAEAYGLTVRERRITELVAQGRRTAAIAAQLYLSTYTVQDHLKAIFEKLDVSSRGELVARLFVDPSLGRGRELPAA